MRVNTSALEDNSYNRDVEKGLFLKFIICSLKTLLVCNIYQMIYKNSFTNLPDLRHSYGNSIFTQNTYVVLLIILSLILKV